MHVANIEALRRAVALLDVAPSYVLTDGFPVDGLGVPGLAMWKGDRVAACISAASVLAKVTRDRLMRELDARVAGVRLQDAQGLHHRRAHRRAHRARAVAGAPDAVRQRTPGRGPGAAARDPRPGRLRGAAAARRRSAPPRRTAPSRAAASLTPGEPGRGPTSSSSSASTVARRSGQGPWVFGIHRVRPERPGVQPEAGGEEELERDRLGDRVAHLDLDGGWPAAAAPVRSERGCGRCGGGPARRTTSGPTGRARRSVALAPSTTASRSASSERKTTPWRPRSSME